MSRCAGAAAASDSCTIEQSAHRNVQLVKAIMSVDPASVHPDEAFGARPNQSPSNVALNSVRPLRSGRHVVNSSPDQGGGSFRPLTSGRGAVNSPLEESGGP